MSSGLPICLTGLHEWRCLVVGGGKVAERKVESLIAAGAKPVLISLAITQRLSAWHQAGKIEYIGRTYQDGDLIGTQLVFAATDDSGLNRQIVAGAKRAGILVDSVDAAAGSNFISLAYIQQGDLTIAISTNGKSPALASYIRQQLETSYGPEFAWLLDWLGRLREGPLRDLSPQHRAQFWNALISDDVVGWVKSGERWRAELLAGELLQALRSQEGLPA